MKKVINFYNFQVFSRLKVNWLRLHFYMIQPLHVVTKQKC